MNIIHLYELPTRVILFDTGVQQADLDNAKNKFEAHKKFYFYKDWVYLSNAKKYETYTGDRNEIAKQNTYKQLSKDVLDWFYKIPDTPQIGVYIPTINHKSETINKKPEIEGDIEKAKSKVREVMKQKGILRSS